MFQRFNRVTLAFVILTTVQLAGCYSPEQRAQQYYEDGRRLLDQHDVQKAEIQFRNAVQLDRNLVPAWRGLAQSEEALHHWQNLVPALREILTLEPSDDTTRLKLAQLLLMGGDADEALHLIDARSASQGQNARLSGLKALISYKLNHKDDAAHQAQAVLKIDPGNENAAIVLALDRLAHKDPKGALDLISAPSIVQTSLGIELAKVNINGQLGDLAAVETLLKTLIAQYPEIDAFRAQLVRLYVKTRQNDKAEQELRSAIAREPKNPNAELSLVRFLYAVKGPERARAELVARIGTVDDPLPYKLALAELEFRQGEFSASEKLLEALAGEANAPKRAQAAKLRLAKMDFERKKLDAAEELASAIVHSDSKNADALALRASIRMQRNQLGSALSDLYQALDIEPGSAQIMLLLASADERMGSIESAERQYSNAVRASNFNPNVGLAYARFLTRRGQIVRAESFLGELARRYPENVAVLSALAEIKISKHDWQGAQEIAAALVQLGSKSGLADEVLGAAFAGENKSDQSISFFEQGVAASPNAVAPLENLVKALVHDKQTGRARSLLQKLLNEKPNDPEVYVLLGVVEAAEGKPDQAIHFFKSAIEKQPRNSKAYVELAAVYLRQKDMEAAESVVRSGLKQMPDDFALHIALGGLRERSGDYDGAIAAYQAAFALEPGSLIAINDLASMLADHRTDPANLERAAALAASLREAAVPQFKDTLGWVSYREGKYTDAIPLLEQASAALPDLALIHYHLGMSYRAVGQKTSALNEFQTALAKSPDPELREKLNAELRKFAN